MVNSTICAEISYPTKRGYSKTRNCYSPTFMAKAAVGFLYQLVKQFLAAFRRPVRLYALISRVKSISSIISSKSRTLSSAGITFSAKTSSIFSCAVLLQPLSVLLTSFFTWISYRCVTTDNCLCIFFEKSIKHCIGCERYMFLRYTNKSGYGYIPRSKSNKAIFPEAD